MKRFQDLAHLHESPACLSEALNGRAQSILSSVIWEWEGAKEPS
jgi:hypothetical protein